MVEETKTVAEETKTVAEETKTVAEETNTPPKAKISVDYRPGRWSKVFHLFDNDGREISLQQADAIQMARSILKIAEQK